MDTTFAELLEMRRKLDAALVEKTGMPLASGFNIEMGSWHNECISFVLAFTKDIASPYRVGGGRCKTPQEAFDSAMEAIDDVEVLTKEDEIRALQAKIDALKA